MKTLHKNNKFLKILMTAVFLICCAFITAKPTSAYYGCPEGGRHKMHIEARAIMYEGTYSKPGKLITSAGKYYECRQCGMGIATQYSPIISRCLGAYIFDSVHFQGSGSLVVSYGVEGYEWDYPTGTLWDGMEWWD